MGKGRPKKIRSNRLTEGDRGRAVGMHEAGMSYFEIAAKLGCSKSSAQAVVKKFENTGSVKDLPKSGRPKKSSPREDRTIKFTSLKGSQQRQ
jgi:transposase